MKIIIDNRSKASDADVLLNISCQMPFINDGRCGWQSDTLKIHIVFIRNKHSTRFVAMDYQL